MDLQGNPVKNWKHKKRIDSFKVAIEGIKATLLAEVNFKIHCIIAILVIFLGLIVQITAIEWLIICMIIGNVFAFEIVNTAIENVVDLVIGNQWHELAKKAKDMSAAAVFIMVIVAVIIGMIIFVPYIIRLL